MTNISECPICLEKCDQNIFLPCKHYFHLDCLQNWLTKKISCPVCRKTPQHIIELHSIHAKNTQFINNTHIYPNYFNNQNHMHRFYRNTIVQNQIAPLNTYRTQNINNSINNQYNLRNNSLFNSRAQLLLNRYNYTTNNSIQRFNSRAIQLITTPENHYLTNFR